jgi:hypothetical protein
MRISILLFVISSCTAPEVPPSSEAPFAEGVNVGRLRGADMSEASGLVASARFPGSYWTHNDSGHDPEVFLTDSTGNSQGVIILENITNRDFEDIARFENTIYVADIGDNRAVRSEISVIAFEEPQTLGNRVVTPSAVYRMTYPDGARDAETLLIDPLTRDWYIITKREASVRVYRYEYPQQAGETVELERIPGVLPMTSVVAGDVSPDGTEILAKTYDVVYYWKRQGNEPLSQTLFRAPFGLPYTPEPQGEAIAFSLSGSGYITTTEEGSNEPQWVKFYRRK